MDARINKEYGMEQPNPVHHLLRRTLVRPVTLCSSRKNLLKKVAEKVQSFVNVSYLRSATNIKLDGNIFHLFTFHYISSAGGFQPHLVRVCRNFTYQAGAFGFCFSTRSAFSLPYFFTFNSCDK